MSIDRKRSCSIKDSIIIEALAKSIRRREWDGERQSADDRIVKYPELTATVTGTRKDIWDVARLPTNVDKTSRPSIRLEKLLKENKVNHNNAIAKLKDSLWKVNFDFEQSYRYNAELLKSFLQKAKDQVQEIVKETLLEPKDTIIFGAIKFCDVSNAICNYGKCSTQAIDKFYKSVLCLEKQRCDSYKNIFKNSYSDVCNISYLMPFQIQEYFEIEIIKFNEILLQNYRCYAELDMILRTDLEQNKTTWLQRFNRNKVKWVNFFKSHGFNTNMIEITSELDINCILSSVSQTIQDRYDEMYTTVTELDDLVNDALRKCKFILLKIYYGEYNELHLLEDHLQIPINADSRDQLMQFKQKLKDILHNFGEDHLLGNGLEEDEDFKTLIEELKERIKLTDEFFGQVCQLWDPHFRREAELKHLVAKDIERIMKNHDVMIEGVEMQLNIYNDSCRSAATVEEMQKNFGYIVAALKKCATMYTDQMDKEKQVLTKYLEKIEIETDILIAEIHRFLVMYRTNHSVPIFAETKESLNEISTLETIYSNLSIIDGQLMPSSCIFPNMGVEIVDCSKPPHILYIDFKITSLDNWSYGIWETVEMKMRKCKDEMLEKARAWIVPHTNAIELRCKQKLALNNIKFYRIWLTVYYMRYIELKRHADRFEGHAKGITNILDKQMECKTKILKEISALVDATVKKMHYLEEDVKTAKSASSLHIGTAKMKALKDNFQKELDQFLETVKVERLSNEYIIRNANVLYLKNILMFSESGNFHADEVKLLSQQIQKGEKDFFKKSERCQKDFLMEIPKISQKVHAIEGSFKNLSNRMKDEFAFLDNINNCMVTLQNEIKKIAYDLKHKKKIVEAHIEKFNELAGELKDNCKNEKIEFCIEKCNDVLKNFDEWYLLLNRSEECDMLPDIKKSTPDKKGSKFKIAKSSSLVPTTDKEMKTGKAASRYGSVSKMNAATSSALLYRKPTKLEDNDPQVVEGEKMSESFNDAVVNVLLQRFEQMRSIGLSFYTTVRSILKKDTIEATFEEFIGNLMAKCAYFQIQCDAMWLEEAIEYTKQTAKYRNGLLKTYNAFMNHYLDYNQARFENTFWNLQVMLNDIEANATLDIRNVHTRLKTLHGFPKNKELLDNLYEEFLKELHLYDARLYDSIGNYKLEHITLKEFILDKLLSIDQSFQNVLLSNEIKDLNRDIFAQILNLFTKLQHLKNKNNTAIPNVEDKDMVTAKIANDRFSAYTSNFSVLPIPEEYVSRFSVSNESYSLDTVSDTFDFDDAMIACVDLAAYSKKMDYILDNHLETISNYENRVVINCENWYAIWHNDVETIKKLYTVKYNIPGDSTNKI